MSFDPPSYEQLALLHARGQLVPFVGSGLSRPACAGWKTMIEDLEAAARVEPAVGDAPEELVQRAFDAVQRLKRRNPAHFPEVLREAVEVDASVIPAATRQLARLHWPLIVTTNYDDLLIRATLSAWESEPRDRRLVLCGRDLNGRRRVVDQLDFPTGSVLWAIQGLLPPQRVAGHAQLEMLSTESVLRDQLVVGHAEYRKVTWQAPGFRRAFSELYRRRSLLFLGSGLAEPYLQELLGETLQLVGPGRTPHFAMVREGEVDAEFLHRRFNIVTLPYPTAEGGDPHANFVPRLRKLMTVLRRPTAAEEVRCRVAPEKKRAGGQSQLILSRVGLPAPVDLDDGAWLAFSCGMARRGDAFTLFPSSTARHTLGESASQVRWVGEFSAVFGGDDRLRGVVARDGDEIAGNSAPSKARRSPGAVHAAFAELLKQASEAGVTCIHTQLLGAGRSRVFEPWVSLAQMARAFGRWAEESDHAIDVVVHGLEEELWRLVWGGHLDLGELLQAKEVRLTVEIDDPHTPERLRIFARPHVLVSDLASKIGVPLRDWTAMARPRPTSNASAVQLRVLRRDKMTVERFGLVPGSTLVLRRDG